MLQSLDECWLDRTLRETRDDLLEDKSSRVRSAIPTNARLPEWQI